MEHNVLSGYKNTMYSTLLSIVQKGSNSSNTRPDKRIWAFIQRNCCCKSTWTFISITEYNIHKYDTSKIINNRCPILSVTLHKSQFKCPCYSELSCCSSVESNNTSLFTGILNTPFFVKLNTTC